MHRLGAYHHCMQELQQVMRAEFGVPISAVVACLLVYAGSPVTARMRQRAAQVVAKYPSLMADIMEGGNMYSPTAVEQPGTLECSGPQAVAAVSTDGASLTILAEGLTALLAGQGHQQLELTVRFLLPDGYATVALQLLMTPRQAGFWAGTVPVPHGCAGFTFVQLEAGRWFGDPLVPYSLWWACRASLHCWQQPPHLHTD